MEKTLKDHLIDTFDDLGKTNTKKFTRKLRDRGTEPRVRQAAIERLEDSGDLADLLVEVFTSRRAAGVAADILQAIGCNEQAADLRENTRRLLDSSVSRPVETNPTQPEHQQLSDGWQRPSHLTPCSQTFKDKILQEKGQEVYIPLVKSERKRLALLVTNIDFDDRSMSRMGADADEGNMEWLLVQLDYAVEKHRNLSGKEMNDVIRSFARREEHLRSDGTFVVIMSHGKRDKILGVHYGPRNQDDFLHVDEIYAHLNSEKCPAMRNKPKVILIQACRGGGGIEPTLYPGEHGRMWASDGEPEHFIGKHQAGGFIHKEKDFISLMSCTPDTVSYRHTRLGTFYVRCIVDVFVRSAHEDHIEELFRKVMMRFESDTHMMGNFRQMVCKDRATMPKLFYLFPGL